MNLDIMEHKETGDKDMLLKRAKRLQKYCDLLIQQCDSWLDPPKIEHTEPNWFTFLRSFFFLSNRNKYDSKY